VAYAAVSRVLAEQGTETPKRPATLWGELYAAGRVALADREQGQRRATFKKRIGGAGKNWTDPLDLDGDGVGGAGIG
jgi:hypothetical protein